MSSFKPAFHAGSLAVPDLQRSLVICIPLWEGLVGVEGPYELVSGVQGVEQGGGAWSNEEKWVSTEEGGGTWVRDDASYWAFPLEHIKDIGAVDQSFTVFIRFRQEYILTSDQQRPISNGYQTSGAGTWWGFEQRDTVTDMRFYVDGGTSTHNLEGNAQAVGWHSTAGDSDRENRRMKQGSDGEWTADEVTSVGDVSVTFTGSLTDGTCFAIGNRPLSGNNNEGFEAGVITVVYVFDRALTHSELMLLDADPYALTRRRTLLAPSVPLDVETEIRPVGDDGAAFWDTAPTVSQDLWPQVDEETPSDTDYIFADDPHP